MSVRKRNGYRDTRRTVSRAATRATRRGSSEAQWLAALAAGMTGCRY